jgi:hypothetical protein
LRNANLDEALGLERGYWVRRVYKKCNILKRTDRDQSEVEASALGSSDQTMLALFSID